ncbi:MAG TPA: hypothetical protein VN428_02330 [Bryobacteraceae bacterium]|nr:hypothetical protein [Bryobacteraceae bacterium]
MLFKNLIAMERKPHFKNVYMYPASESLAHIPDSGTNVVLVSPAEIPDGTITVFAFSSAPKYLCYNGNWLIPNVDYAQVGSSVALAKAPETGAVLRAVI